MPFSSGRRVLSHFLQLKMPSCKAFIRAVGRAVSLKKRGIGGPYVRRGSNRENLIENRENSSSSRARTMKLLELRNRKPISKELLVGGGMLRPVLLLLSLSILVVPMSLRSENLLHDQESDTRAVIFDRYPGDNWKDGGFIQTGKNGIRKQSRSELGRNIVGRRIVGYIQIAAVKRSVSGRLARSHIHTLNSAGVNCASDTVPSKAIPSDVSGHMCVSEYYGYKVYRVDVGDDSHSLFVRNGFSAPDAIKAVNILGATFMVNCLSRRARTSLVCESD